MSDYTDECGVRFRTYDDERRKVTVWCENAPGHDGHHRHGSLMYEGIVWAWDDDTEDRW